MSTACGRALDLLEHVTRSSKPLSLMEIASQCGADKSTASRLLRFLVARDLLRRDQSTKRYEVGAALLALAAAAVRRSDVRSVASGRIAAIRDATGETTTLHIRIGTERVVIDGMESHHPVRRAVTLGDRVPLYEGPASKAILAFLPDDESARLLNAARRAGFNKEEIKAQLEFLRRHGYLMVVGDRTPGIGAVSVPIFGAGGVVASITVSGPADRWSPERMRDALPSILSVASEISAALGGGRPPMTLGDRTSANSLTVRSRPKVRSSGRRKILSGQRDHTAPGSRVR